MDIKLLVNPSGPETVKADNGATHKRKLDESSNNSTKRRRIDVNDSDEGSDSDISTVYSRRSTATSISSLSSNDNTPSPYFLYGAQKPKDDSNGTRDILQVIDLENSSINDCEEVMRVFAQNCHRSLQLSRITFVDEDLPKITTTANLTEEQETAVRQNVVTKIHEKYVEPLLDITGFRWVRKEVPSKGRGVKVFSIKYTCSQQSRRNGKSIVTSDNNRSRQLSHPLKQYDCESSYSIKYVWSSQTIEINYKHLHHPPYKRLPEKLKPYIRDRLDMKALDLYNEILGDPQFGDVKHLIFFGKVQSFWSKERSKKKEKSTKEAFKQFFQG